MLADSRPYTDDKTHRASTRTRCDTQTPAATKASAAAVCSASSRVARRTRTLVSTARMTGFHVAARPLFEVLQRLRLRRLGEQGTVHIFGRIAARPPDHDASALLLPFQDRSRADAEPTADFSRYGDLTLRGELRMGDRHAR